MKDKVEGLVLSAHPYGENGERIVVLTKDKGYLSFILRGSAKLNAKNKVLPLGRYEFMYDAKQGKTLFSLQQRNFIGSYYIDSLKELAFRNVLLEMCEKMPPEQSDELYADLCFVFEHLNGDNDMLLGCFLASRILFYNGLRPYTEGCVRCNDPHVVGISYDSGGFMCRCHCHSGEDKTVDTLRKFRYINCSERKNVLRISEDISLDDFAIWISFMNRYGDVPMRSYSFYRLL